MSELELQFAAVHLVWFGIVVLVLIRMMHI